MCAGSSRTQMRAPQVPAHPVPVLQRCSSVLHIWSHMAQNRSIEQADGLNECASSSVAPMHVLVRLCLTTVLPNSDARVRVVTACCPPQYANTSCLAAEQANNGLPHSIVYFVG